MRILIIGASGTIGREVVKALTERHEIIEAGRHGAARVDIDDPASIRELFSETRNLDAVVVAAGGAAFAPLAELRDDDFAYSLRSKLMGQVNVVRYGLQAMNEGGSFTLTSGVLAQQPAQGSAAVSLVNAGLEGFARAAALDLPRGMRINVVGPGWVSETLSAMGRDPSAGIPAARVAAAYVRSVEGTETGTVINAS